ncbi:MAG: PDZ domain-containing protein [Allobranchiibius sp.]
MILAVVAVLVVAALNLIHLPVAILRPGPAQDTLGKVGGKPVIAISGHPTYPTTGSLDFTTVSLAGGPQYPVSIWQWAQAHLNSDAEIGPVADYFPKDVTSKQVQQQGAADMAGSQQTAQVLALRTAGIDVPETISVGLLTPGSPAAKQLKVKDIIRSIDGTALTRLGGAQDVLDKVTPGSSVTVAITRAGKAMTLTVPTVKATQGKGARLGFYPVPNYTLPFKVDVNAGDVGGPSAGTMFTLAIYDKITPGPLTGGNKIAGTGTIAEDGTIGPIGGIRQKMIGAKNAGAKYFLAPVSDCTEARGHVPSGLTVVRVGTFAEALASVKRVASNKVAGLPTC